MNIYLSIGSNIENRKRNLTDAYRRISKLGKVKSSHIYRTESWGRENLGKFLNACIILETELDFNELLSKLQKMEEEMGRIRKQKWESRKIDIDILFCEDIIFRNPILEIPHKYLRNRRFYLEPLNEIAQDKKDPITGKTINELLIECKDKKKVWKTGNILQLKV